LRSDHPFITYRVRQQSLARYVLLNEMRLFANKYRYLLILLLGTYSYANITYLETFHYYGIREQPVF